MNIQELEKRLSDVGYIPSKEITVATSAAINSRVPILIEGAPGVGKTALAKAVSEALSLPLIRVQFYEGLTYDKILYDYNYQKQLLTIEAMRSALEDEMKGKSVGEALSIAEKIDFYGEDFLIKRPILQAFSSDTPCVLLLDEIDKASEEIEYTLLEALDEYAITIPQFGRFKCKEENRPIVFLTSNSYRELSDALKRRCGYLYLMPKTVNEMKAIIIKKAEVNDALALSVATCIDKITHLPLKQTPSVSEAVMWAQYLKEQSETVTKDTLDEALFILIKNKKDRELVKDNISVLV